MNKSYHKGYLHLEASTIIDGTDYTFTVRKKTAKTLLALIHRGENGITALELSNTWALRLSVYISTLRHRHNLDIETVEEGHEDGWHGRYILHNSVKILRITHK